MSHIHIIHVPKTGGLCLRDTLQSVGVPVTRSHDPAVAFDQPTGTRFVMVLRDPIERVISLYRHLYRRGNTDISLSDFACALPRPDRKYWWGAANVQAFVYGQVAYSLMPVVYCSVDSAVRGICERLSVTPPDDIPHINAARPDGIVVTDADRLVIADCNQFDRILWRDICGARRGS